MVRMHVLVLVLVVLVNAAGAEELYPADPVPIFDEQGELVAVQRGPVVFPAHVDADGEVEPDAVNNDFLKAYEARSMVRSGDGTVYLIPAEDELIEE